MGRGGNMGTKGGLGVQIAEIALDGEPLDGVGIIAAPNLGREAEHAKVKPVAAGRAAFQQHIGPGFKDTPQHIVKAKDIMVNMLEFTMCST